VVGGAERWTDPAFIASAHAWLRSACERDGREVWGPIAQIHTWPWSTVFRARTSRGVVYLKCCGPSQAHEPRLTALLQRVASRDVPTLIARHPRRDWMLLEDGGRKIREVARGAPMLREWERILPRYAGIQIALLGRERELLTMGTPDHGLRRLAPGVAEILDDGGVTRRPGHDQLSADDRRRVRRTLRVIDERASELAATGIGPTIQHDDLHSANILRKGGRTVVFDWGDACVSHPFLTLTIALRAAAHHGGVRRSDARVARIRDAYLEPFSTFATMAELRRAARIGDQLGMVSRALTWYRVATLSGGPLDIGRETFAGWLRLLPGVFRSA
jgi:hypothetical protein